MQSFTFQLPTHVRFGVGVIEGVGETVAAYGKTALLVYGGGSIKRNGVYDTVVTGLKSAGVTIVEHAGVTPNPRLSHAEAGVRRARESGVDVVVAVGGGSVIDESKGVACGAVDGAGDLWDFYARRRKPTDALPVVAVQTVPASSSEMNPVSVLTNDETLEKFSLRSPAIYPKAAFLDPAVTTTIPLEYTAYACTDILSHVMEGYFTTTDPSVPLQDGMVEGLAKAVIGAMNTLLENPADIDARSTVMWAGGLAWSGLMNAGVGGAAIPNHMVEHPLSAYYDIAHGAGLSIVIPAWLSFMRDRITERIIRFGYEILQIGDRLDGRPPAEQADIVIAALTEWYRSIGTPVSFAEAGLDDVDIDRCTEQALSLSELWGVKGYTADDIREVYRRCAG